MLDQIKVIREQLISLHEGRIEIMLKQSLTGNLYLFKFFDYNPYSSLCDTLPVAKNNGSVFLAFYMIDHSKYSKQSAQFSTLL